MTSPDRTSSGLAALLLSISILLPSTALAQNGGISLELAPHCTSSDRSTCPRFETLDASHLKTPLLKAGDILDIDVVLVGAAGKDARTVRSFLTYDTKVLEARSVELTDAIQAPSPGEQTTSKSTGVVKIGGELKTVDLDRITVARVTFRVLSAGTNTTVAFQNFRDDGAGQTAVNGKLQIKETESRGLALPPCTSALVGCRGTPTPLLTTEPSKLTVMLGETPAQQAQAAGTESPSSPASATSPLAASALFPTDMTMPTTLAQFPAAMESTPLAGQGSSTFSLLQVQNVRVTTRDTQIFLGWDQLQSAELAGYNVYYGTVSGKYIQRRSIPSSASSLVLRDLEPGSTYYLAVRASGNKDQETVFSQEVSITVGKPETSSSPLTVTQESLSPPENMIVSNNGTSLSGSTGTSDTIIILALASAAIGTAFAFLRQISFKKLSHAA